MYDIAIIGGGVTGGAIARKLASYKLDLVILEKEDDVCSGASKANSGIAHAGFDAKPNTKKAYFNVLGSKMMKAYCEELGVKYKNNGALVLAFNEDEERTLEELMLRGEENGVEDLQLLDGERLHEIEPHVSARATAALYAKTSAIICPYDLTFACIGNAMDNGAELKTEFFVTDIVKEGDLYKITSQKGESVTARVIINSAGAGSGRIASLVGDDSVNIGLRKGEYILLDRESGDFVSHTIFCTPTKAGKGILVTNTVDGNILLGPTAEEIEEEDKNTSESGLRFVRQKASEMAENVPFYNTITSFAGIRAYSADRHDFIVEKSAVADNFVNVAGIESPGLTSAPAIADYVAEKILAQMIDLVPDPSFKPRREKEIAFSLLDEETQNQMIAQNPAYGRLVCRCEKVTEGEIVAAIHRNPPAKTIDGIKRRTRAGMGRCQGGFCQARVAEIIASELNIPLEEVTKCGEGSELVVGKTKNGD